MENRSGLSVDTRVTQTNGVAEREAALSMAADLPQVSTESLWVRTRDTTARICDWFAQTHRNPHVAHKRKGSAIDGRITRHQGYALSQKKRKRVEEIFGWMKTVAWLRKARYRGEEKIDWLFTLSAAAYNMVLMRNLGIVAS